MPPASRFERLALEAFGRKSSGIKQLHAVMLYADKSY